MKHNTDKITKIKTLYTRRLVLKELTLDHVADYQAGFADYEIIRHLTSRVSWPFPENGVQDFLRSAIIPYQEKTLWRWRIFLKESPHRLIGSIALRQNDTDNRGFWLAKPYWKHDYMTKATDITTNYGFNELGFEALRFTNAKGNHPSRRLKEKAGAKLVKTTPIKAGHSAYTEAECWELTKEDWEKKKCENQLLSKHSREHRLKGLIRNITRTFDTALRHLDLPVETPQLS